MWIRLAVPEQYLFFILLSLLTTSLKTDNDHMHKTMLSAVTILTKRKENYENSDTQ